LENDHCLKLVDHIGMKLVRTKLLNAPLTAVPDLAASNAARIRVDTVHQAKGERRKAKGESLDAVL